MVDTSPDFVATLTNQGKTYPITGNAASITVYTPAIGRYFVVYHYYLQATGATNVTWLSGATALSGVVPYAAHAEKEHNNNGAMIMKGRAKGDALVITNSAPAQIDGWVVITEVDR